MQNADVASVCLFVFVHYVQKKDAFIMYVYVYVRTCTL